MKTLKGNLLNSFEKDFNVILHGCNCFSTMGAGIAKQIAEKYPEAYRADKSSPMTLKEKKEKIAGETLDCFKMLPTPSMNLNATALSGL